MISASTSNVESFTIVCGPTSSQPETTIAVGLFDASSDSLFMRFRPDLKEVISEEELDVIEATEEHLSTLIEENGATATMEWMQETLSNFVRFDGPNPVKRPNNFEAALGEIYDANITLKTRAVAASQD